MYQYFNRKLPESMSLSQRKNFNLSLNINNKKNTRPSMRSKDVVYANTIKYASDEDEFINIPLSVLEINEKNEQLARTSTFYLPKYHDPQPGTTNDLVIGSLVEVSNDVSNHPLYGVVRWMGVENGTNFILVGIELEEEQSHLPLTLTDGTHNGERLFRCGEKRALFVPLDQCQKDSRFQDVTPTLVHESAAPTHLVVSFYFFFNNSETSFILRYFSEGHICLIYYFFLTTSHNYYY